MAEDDPTRAAREGVPSAAEELEQLYYAVSHDLRAPLRAVLNFSQLLERPGLSPDKAAKYRAFVLDGARQMEAMIEGLLTLSRLGRDDTPVEPVSLDQALDQATDELSSELEASAAVVERAPLPTVLGRPAPLARLWRELLHNAVRFRGPRPPHVRVGTVEDEGRVWCSIRDHGIGIDPADHDRARQLFARLHHRSEYPGEGVGLAIAQRVVTVHGGALRLHSPPEGGLEVRFALPLPASQESPA